MPYGLALLVARSLQLRGHGGMAVMVLLSFDLYLRVNEALRLDITDVTLPGMGAATGTSAGGIHIRIAKTGVNQSVLLRSSLVIELLRRHASNIASGPLFSFSYKQYTSQLASVLQELDIAHVDILTPHSLRHGGASHDFLRGVPLADIIARGRWASVEGGRRYIQAGRALLLSLRLPQTVESMCRQLTTSPSLLLQ